MFNKFEIKRLGTQEKVNIKRFSLAQIPKICFTDQTVSSALFNKKNRTNTFGVLGLHRRGYQLAFFLLHGFFNLDRQTNFPFNLNDELVTRRTE